jgi:hypothetical protein
VNATAAQDIAQKIGRSKEFSLDFAMITVINLHTVYN